MDFNNDLTRWTPPSPKLDMCTELTGRASRIPHPDCPGSGIVDHGGAAGRALSLWLLSLAPATMGILHTVQHATVLQPHAHHVNETGGARSTRYRGQSFLTAVRDLGTHILPSSRHTTVNARRWHAATSDTARMLRYQGSTAPSQANSPAALFASPSSFHTAPPSAKYARRGPANIVKRHGSFACSSAKLHRNASSYVAHTQTFMGEAYASAPGVFLSLDSPPHLPLHNHDQATNPRALIPHWNHCSALVEAPCADDSGG
ncbi:hypothetical protein VTO73DRAFT_14493 [Trametes versicolor]